MSFWRRALLEQQFWEEPTTRSFLLAIDRSFWGICLVNRIAESFFFPRIFTSTRVKMFLNVVGASYLMAAIAVAVAIKRNQASYYRHRGKIMVLNRLVRIVSYVIASSGVDEQMLNKVYVSDKIAAGRPPLLVIFLILTQLTGNYLLWTLYFPLPFSQGVWLDLVQQGARFFLSVIYCVKALEHPDLRPTATAVCQALNASLSIYSMATIQMQDFDRRCVEDAPLLLSLFSWWFFGSFLPTYTAWYCESMLRQKFLEQRGEAEADEPQLWGSTQRYLLEIFVMSCMSWLVLQLLLLPPVNRDLVVRLLVLLRPGSAVS